MNTILKPLNAKDVLVYLDDIIVIATTFEEHLGLLREEFKSFINAGLTVKLEKCKLMRKELKCLGVRITRDGVKIHEKKIEDIMSMSCAKNYKRVATFLGIAAWFSIFIPPFRKYANHCTHLKGRERNLPGHYGSELF